MGSNRNIEQLWLFALFFAIFTVFLVGAGILARTYWENEESLHAILVFAGFGGLLFGYGVFDYATQPLRKRNTMLDFTLKETLHELKIPIATIRANAQMLRDLPDVKQQKRVQRIEQATQALLERYGQLDYFIRLEIEKVALENIDLLQIIEKALNQIEELREERNLSLELTPHAITIDSTGLERVLLNLLHNAIKHTDSDGSIQIRLHAGILSIEDNGEGMDEVTRLRVLERYYQGSNAEEGYGLGLAFVGFFCAHYDIPLQIRSEPSIGTSVYLNLNTLLH